LRREQSCIVICLAPPYFEKNKLVVLQVNWMTEAPCIQIKKYLDEMAYCRNDRCFLLERV